MKRGTLGVGFGLSLFLLLLSPALIFADDARKTREPELIDQHPSDVLSPDQQNDARARISAAEAVVAAQAGLLPPNVKTLLDVRESLKHGEFVWDDQGVPGGKVRIWVDLRRQTISVFRSGHEIGTALIAYGTDEKETPIGTFKVLSKHRHYRSRAYNAEMPYSLFITADGIALHSSPLRARHATHGCVGLPDQFARRLFQLAGVGTTVDISRSDPAFAKRIAKSAIR